MRWCTGVCRRRITLGSSKRNGYWRVFFPFLIDFVVFNFFWKHSGRVVLRLWTVCLFFVVCIASVSIAAKAGIQHRMFFLVGVESQPDLGWRG